MKSTTVNGQKRQLNLSVGTPQKSLPRQQPLGKNSAVTRVDLRSKMPGIWDQQDIGSCTAFASIACFSLCDPKWNGSKLFQYYNSRIIDDGDATDDDGTTMFAAARALTKYGICNEKSWPYDTKKHAVKPSEDCFQEALDHQALQVSVVQQNESQIKACLQQGFPLMFGFLVFNSFLKINSTGIMPMPKPREGILGGHAVICCGYDEAKRVWICRNSWGTGWGDKGYFYMPYNYLTNRRYCEGLYKVTKVEV